MVIQPLETFPVALAGLVYELCGVKVHLVGATGNATSELKY